MNIKTFIALEDRFIYQYANQFLNRERANAQDSEKKFAELDKLIPSIAKKIHRQVLLNLIFTFISKRFPKEAESAMSICFATADCKCSLYEDVSCELIPSLCEQLHVAFLGSKFTMNDKSSKVRSKSKEQIIESGAVYTQSRIAKDIIKETVKNMLVPLESSKILDFACGTGRFYENIITLFQTPASAVLNNVYAIDIDECAVFVTRLKALSVFNKVTPEICKIICKHIIHKDGLRKNTSIFAEPLYLSSDDLDGLTDSGFDAIVSNPPYRVLKPNKNKFSKDGIDRIQEQLSYYRTCGFYQYSIEGMLNLYKLSIERVLQMLKKGGVMGVICPSTLFGDLSTSRLRKHLLLDNRVICVKFFAEKDSLFENVSQATNIFVLQKGGKTCDISISEQNESFDVNISLVKELFPDNLEIPTIKSLEWDILRKLAQMKKMKQMDNIRNRRGELDLSLYKDFITTERTPYRLVRGNMIGENKIKDINGEFVNERFIGTRSEEYRLKDFNKKRLICQQISNGGVKKRLKFVFCAAGDILGNSCNYISADKETLEKLYLVLNSSILNWRFNITSSNNHINNYELGELPIIDLSLVDSSMRFSTQQELDNYINSLYGLSLEESKMVTL